MREKGIYLKKIPCAPAVGETPAWGFSDELGPIDYADNQGEVFLGQQLVQSKSVSGTTARKIEEEVRGLVQAGMDEARRILTE